MGRSLRAVNKFFEDFNTEGKKVGLKINESKTKVLIHANERRQVGQTINVGDYNVAVVTDFIYLGTRLTSKNKN